MHEIAFCQRIIDEAKKLNAQKEVTVEVGELADLSVDEVRETIEKLSDDLKFNVIFRNSKIQCSCGYEGKANILDKGHGYCIFNCPSCSGKPKVLEGGAIKITEYE